MLDYRLHTIVGKQEQQNYWIGKCWGWERERPPIHDEPENQYSNTHWNTKANHKDQQLEIDLLQMI